MRRNIVVILSTFTNIYTNAQRGHIRPEDLYEYSEVESSPSNELIWLALVMIVIIIVGLYIKICNKEAIKETTDKQSKEDNKQNEGKLVSVIISNKTAIAYPLSFFIDKNFEYIELKKSFKDITFQFTDKNGNIQKGTQRVRVKSPCELAGIRKSKGYIKTVFKGKNILIENMSYDDINQEILMQNINDFIVCEFIEVINKYELAKYSDVIPLT